MKKLSVQYNAPFTLSFCLFCGLIYLVDQYTEGAALEKVFSLTHTDSVDLMTAVHMLCYVFGHKTPEILAQTIIPILVIGPILEERYGITSMLFASLGAVLLTGVIYFVAFPSTAEPLMGAGCILYLMLMMASLGGSASGAVPITMILALAAFILSEVLQTKSGLRIDHIVGGIFGMAVGLSLRSAPEAEAGKPAGGRSRSR